MSTDKGKTVHYRVILGAAAERAAARFIQASKWFECTPYPDDEYLFTLKAEPGVIECLTKADVVYYRTDEFGDAERCDECTGTRWPKEMHEKHCSLHEENHN
jgi:hypothetical protein